MKEEMIRAIQETLGTRAIRAAIYIRVSSKNQEKGYSLETQLEGCLKYCRERGYIVEEEHIYRETMTGVIYRERVVLNAARAAARRREFDVIVVYDVDRFSRDPVHQLIISDELSEHKVRLESVLREIDESDEGKLIQFTRGYAAKLEYERFRDRVERGLRARVEMGHLRAGGHPLYGYEWVDGVKKKIARQYSTEIVYIDEQNNEWTKADVVSHVFKLLKQGYTLADVAVELNERNIPTPEGGKQWRRETISRIANNPTYAGISESLKKQYTKDANGKQHAKVRPVEERIRHKDDVTPPLVSIEDFEAIQRQLERHRQLATRNNQNPEMSLLRGGYARCAYCNRAMRTHRRYRHTRKNGQSYELWYYECPRGETKDEKCVGNPQIKIEELDNAAWTFIQDKINNPQEVEKHIRSELEQGNQLAQEDASIRNSLQNVQAEQESLLNDLKHLHPKYKPTVYAQLNKLAGIEEELEKNLRQVATLLKSQEEVEVELQDFKKWCNNFRSSVNEEDAPYERKREACERFNIVVKVYERDPGTGESRFEIEAEPVIVLRDTYIHHVASRR